MTHARSSRRNIALVGYDGAQSLDLVGPFEVFGMANYYSGTQTYQIMLVSPRGATSSPIRACASPAPSRSKTCRAISTPSSSPAATSAASAAPSTAKSSLGCAHEQSAHRASAASAPAPSCSPRPVCSMAARATTHWESCDELRRMRPQVELEPDAIYVADPPFYTSAGVTAGFDLCLSVVEADCGADIGL